MPPAIAPEGLRAPGGRPRDEDRRTRKPLPLWDRIKFLVLLTGFWWLLVLDQTSSNPLVSYPDAMRIELRSGFWVIVLAGLEVIRPVFSGDPANIRQYHEENLASCDGVLILFGAGDYMWVRRKLGEIQKAPGYGRTKPQPTIGIGLIGERTPEKEQFQTHEAIVLPQWEGFALEAMRPFLEKLTRGGSA